MNAPLNSVDMLLPRVSSKLKRIGECLLWQGAKNEGGYGTMWFNGKRNKLVHRYSYEISIGYIPEGLCVLHKCDNKLCVEPKHLFLGTRIDNNKDRDNKKRTVIMYGEQNGRSKLSKDDVNEIKYRLKKNESMASIGRVFNVKYQTISAIKRNITWKNV